MPRRPFEPSDTIDVLPPIQLAVLDMAGTTVADDGLVEQAFTRAIATQGIRAGTTAHEHMLDYVRATMGEPRISVFRALLDGDERRAHEANQAFERVYGELVGAGACTALPGAVETIESLRGAGIYVALTTGFSRSTQNAILNVLGWYDLVDLALSPADAGRGRPYPDLVFAAIMRLGLSDVRAVAVAGDTASDMLTARRAGVPVAAGVLTGAHSGDALRKAGATHVLNSVAGLTELLVEE
ncbi:phosphonatase-like hydrolase [Salinactinospora qingdaonensis]|uniref:Phosphonatase-like hydrolase n=1 Tax=Salinactinospora qingdaonensis TaxID=702744 RepID=A0ABP7GKF1_9ACTN